jgi:pyruvate dehydrogenase kinase 2/3/4
VRAVHLAASFFNSVVLKGILQLQETYGIDTKTEQSIQYFLDRFLMSRISVRMLINQHVLMFSESVDTAAGHIGSIHTHCKVLDVVQDAYDNAKFLCEQYYLSSPDVEVVVENGMLCKFKRVKF